MINNSMKQEPIANKDSEVPASEKKPNETGGVYFSTHLKIFDPNTKEVLVQKRADD